jgi:hypothetical protein
VVRPIWNAELTSHSDDASLDLPGLAEAIAPTSTITGAALIHAAWADAAEKNQVTPDRLAGRRRDSRRGRLL